MNNDRSTQPPPTVDIVLASYNGAEFIGPQIESILSQSYLSWRLLCRDDGSSDDTRDILAEFARAHPGRISLLEDNAGNLGFAGNFSRLLESSTADYVALCDQDDIWLPDRISRCMEAMSELERAHGQTAPLMVHTDLRVVDRDLKPIHESFWRLQGVAPSSDFELNRALVRSGVTGNTVLLNKPLKEMVLPIPPGVRAHDWWLALHAAAFGKVAHLSTATVLYRQHDRNAMGAVAVFRLVHLLRGTTRPLGQFSDRMGDLSETLRQAAVFHQRTVGKLSADQDRLVRDFIGYPDSCFLERLRFFVASRVLPNSPSYWIAYLLLPYFLKRASRT